MPVVEPMGFVWDPMFVLHASVADICACWPKQPVIRKYKYEFLLKGKPKMQSNESANCEYVVFAINDVITRSRRGSSIPFKFK